MLRLPLVGPWYSDTYRLAAILPSVALPVAAAQVTVNVYNGANRTGLARGKTPLAVELGLLKAVPPAYRKDAHHWLILHGRYVCKARKAECGRCIIADLCAYKEKT